MPRPSVEDAEQCFMQSLELSRRRGARAWELRTAVDLATLLADQGRRENGRRFCSRCLSSSWRAGTQQI